MIRQSNELQVGKAGEYLVCADLIMKGFVAYLSEQGLPYDVLLDTGKRLLRIQVKTTLEPRKVPQRNKESHMYIFNVKRKGRNGTKKYTPFEIDLFALVCLDTRKVGYLLTTDMPDTINIRVDSLKGSYYDEKGVKDYIDVMACKEKGFNRTQTSVSLGLSIATVSRMCDINYKPHITNARYFSDFERNTGWFYGI